MKENVDTKVTVGLDTWLLWGAGTCQGSGVLRDTDSDFKGSVAIITKRKRVSPVFLLLLLRVIWPPQSHKNWPLFEVIMCWSVEFHWFGVKVLLLHWIALYLVHSLAYLCIWKIVLLWHLYTIVQCIVVVFIHIWMRQGCLWLLHCAECVCCLRVILDWCQQKALTESPWHTTVNTNAWGCVKSY